MSPTYKSCVTFGRFNIGHHGHVDLIQKMLSHGEKAFVYVSGGSLNNTWELRVLMLKALCRRVNMDLSRVTFKKANNPFSAVKDVISCSEFGETALVLGSDQVTMGIKLSCDLDVPLILNERKFSSTNVRFLIDSKDEHTLSSCYRDRYVTRLAKVLRQEEVYRERSNKYSAQTTGSLKTPI